MYPKYYNYEKHLSICYKSVKAIINNHQCYFSQMSPESLCDWGSFQTIQLLRSSVQFSSIQLLSHIWLCDPRDCGTARPPCPSPTPRVYPNSCPLSRWCHPASGGQSVGVSALASVLPMNSQDWFPLGWTGWLLLLSKGLSRVFSNTRVQKHQFFGTQLSL